MRQKSIGWVFGAATCLAAVSVQATPITLTPTYNPQRNLSWQNIEGTSYSFADANSNNLVDVGESVSFSIEMDKANWGTHDYDALKFWIYTPGSSTNLYVGTGVWDFDVRDVNLSQPWSYRPWEGPTKTFTFSYTFTTAGDFNLAASVMCSADLSGLYNDGYGTFDKPTQRDWNAWTRTAHIVNPVYQGESEFYRLTVHNTQAVPEPGTMALLLLGFAGLAGRRYLRRR